MERKIIGIFVCMLMIVTVFLPVEKTMDVGITSIKEETTEKLEMVSTSTLCQGDGNEADEEQLALEITVSTSDPPPDKPEKP